ncbi:MAG: ribosome maturation factor RimM [Oscillospiraceae bacterium]|nr:ribosome maturation factor RimM [Clostridiaceae bacterium]MDO4494912.1 ribosome maturation factor RimM [Clostridiaceae bacterium]MDY5948078.1 ribosome maturation factor RimM [Oscillospiraceae bacterium]
MIKEYLEIGEIVGTHGVHGELRLNPWCDSPDFVSRFKTLYYDSNGGCAAQIKSARPHGNIVLLRIAGIDSVEQAQKMRGKILYMKRSDAKLPEGRYFIAELTGCSVFDADEPQKCYGTLSDVSATGANDVWHITDGTGREYLIPAIPDVVIETDVANDRIVIRPLKGIFDDED